MRCRLPGLRLLLLLLVSAACCLLLQLLLHVDGGVAAGAALPALPLLPLHHCCCCRPPLLLAEGIVNPPNPKPDQSTVHVHGIAGEGELFDFGQECLDRIALSLGANTVAAAAGERAAGRAGCLTAASVRWPCLLPCSFHPPACCAERRSQPCAPRKRDCRHAAAGADGGRGLEEAACGADHHCAGVRWQLRGATVASVWGARGGAGACQ